MILIDFGVFFHCVPRGTPLLGTPLLGMLGVWERWEVLCSRGCGFARMSRWFVLLDFAYWRPFSVARICALFFEMRTLKVEVEEGSM